MEEKEYSQLVTDVLQKIEKSFENVDPDLAECDFSQGTLTVVFADDTRLILSQQPSVRQIWVAAASKGMALHFNFETRSGLWLDDKGKGVELVSFVRELVHEVAKVDLRLV